MSDTQHAAVKALFNKTQLTLIAGPCVIESLENCLEVAHFVQDACAKRNIPYIFKASFDKANRTSISSYRGPGIENGLKILSQVKTELGIPILTDIHTPEQADMAKGVIDVLQIPAFLCRQTDLLSAAAKTKIPTCIKKGQFLSPEEIKHAVGKFRDSGGTQVAVTERGSSFGYNNLVVDMRGLEIMAEQTNAPVIFDATHSVQKPGGADGTTAGDRRFAPTLARAAAAVGIDGLFCEVHPNPDQAKSDGPNCLTFSLLEKVLNDIWAIDKCRRALL